MEAKELLPKIRFSKAFLETLTKDEFCVLAYYQTSQPKTLKDMQRLLGIGSDRLIKTLSSLKDRLLIQGKATKPETVELMPGTLPSNSDIICQMPMWVLFTVKGRAADKQLLCYYFRESGNFEGTVTELAEGLRMKHRNANYCIEFMAKKKVIKRTNLGHRIKLELLEQPRRGILGALFGG